MKKVWNDKLKGKKAFTDKEKRYICDCLLLQWLKIPDLRFGQLISNAVCKRNKTKNGDPFFIEDFDLLDGLEEFTTYWTEFQERQNKKYNK